MLAFAVCRCFSGIAKDRATPLVDRLSESVIEDDKKEEGGMGIPLKGRKFKLTYVKTNNYLICLSYFNTACVRKAAC